jgi:type II secretory ATPase GspE/PulE/Tfp pilus assembly ATPase PilB-like protein/CheY-like chemotaxis protein
MLSETGRLHWLVTLVEHLGHPASTMGDVSADLPLADAWAAITEKTGVVDDDLVRAVAEHFRLGVADMMDAQERALKLLPEAVARRYRVFPLRETDRDLVVATGDPTDYELEQVLGFASGRRPVFEIAAPAAIIKAIDEHYAPDRVVENLLQAVDDTQVERVNIVDEQVAKAVAATEAGAAPVVKLTNVILRSAVEQQASDIHIEPGRHGGHVRLRVDGVLREHMPLPMPALNRVVSRIKIIGGLDIADRLRPQDGRTRIRIRDRVYDLRISTVPTRDSEKAVIRILDPEGSLGLDDLQLPRDELARLRRLIGFRDGIVLVTGPTGSGKTTTLYAALREIATGEVNIMTVEDPVEYELASITQIQVETKRGVTFASALRAILRQDPDVILVGEIRDLETAEIAVQAALTGHLVLATLHANDAAGAVTRLVDLGVDRAVIGDALRGALAQRLGRRVCAHCSAPASPDTISEHEASLAERYGVAPVVRAVGCPRCGGTGYRGRVAIIELIAMTKELRGLIASGVSAVELRRAAVAAGMRPLQEAGLERVHGGVTTLEEIERVLGDVVETAPLAGDMPRVLLVDDDGVVRTLARGLLEKNEFQVAEARDGLAALERLDGSERFDLVVLDLEMPRLDGRETLRRIRGNVVTAALPVIVLTGSEDESLEIDLMEEGADDYIRKPLEPARFLARVRGALRRAGTA